MHPLAVFFEKYSFYRKTLLFQQTLHPIIGTQNIAYFTAFLEQDHIEHQWIVQTLSEILVLPWIDLNEMEADQISLSALPPPILNSYPILPLFQKNQRLYIGLSNPFMPLLLEKIRFYLQQPIEIILVEKPKLDILRQTILRNASLPLKAFIPSVNHKTSISSENPDSKEASPLIGYVNQLLYTAVYKNASDIHLEPHDQQVLIRFRIDGRLYPQPSPPISPDLITSCLKIMAALDISEKRLPQNGRFHFTLPEPSKTIDCRMSSCPTLQGEKIAIRLLGHSNRKLSLQQLGLNDRQYDWLLHALHKPQGMILVTGPTGSGKTFTLYSALDYLNKKSVNIYSAEDPVEIYLPGIHQINIRPDLHFDFPEVLKALLRQDPDIMMIGEIRDSKSAEIAVQAAQTGHLVLSTLHTNRASETITRLMHMGVLPYHLADAIQLIIAQRLLPSLCIHCKSPDTLSCELLAQYHIKTEEPIKIFKRNNCPQCTDGYKDRLPIFECLRITPTIQKLILQNQSPEVIESTAKSEGMTTLKENAFAQLKAGLIDWETMYPYI